MSKTNTAAKAKASRPAQGSKVDEKTTTDRNRNLAKDRDTGADHAAAELKKNGDGNGNAAVKAGEGEITQNKPDIHEALAAERTLGAVGEGSITETAPAVTASTTSEASPRVVQQGDTVILHTPNPWNTSRENPGKVLKVNQDGTIAVRIPIGSGQYKDFSPVYNGQRNGEDWFSWPSKDQEHALDDIERAE